VSWSELKDEGASNLNARLLRLFNLGLPRESQTSWFNEESTDGQYLVVIGAIQDDVKQRPKVPLWQSKVIGSLVQFISSTTTYSMTMIPRVRALDAI